MKYEELKLLSEEDRQAYLAQLPLDDRLALLQECSRALRSQIAEIDEKMYEEEERLLLTDAASREMADALMVRLTSRKLSN